MEATEYWKQTLHCTQHHRVGSYRRGSPGLGLGHWVPLCQGAPVEGVPHKPVRLVWKHTATTSYMHALLDLVLTLPSCLHQRWKSGLTELHVFIRKLKLVRLDLTFVALLWVKNLHLSSLTSGWERGWLNFGWMYFSNLKIVLFHHYFPQNILPFIVQHTYGSSAVQCPHIAQTHKTDHCVLWV